MFDPNIPLTTTEAATIAGRHRRTVITWIRRGWLPAFKQSGERGPYSIKREDLEAFLKDRYTPKPYVPQENQR